jgi:O-antigen/teichoic acid export membrane protein
MLLRNSLWNLAGAALPALVALATVPWLIRGLGLEGFGIVTVIGAIVGYAGLFDISLSAGAIKYLAEHHARGDARRFAETFWFGLIFYGLLGLAGGLLLFALAGPLLVSFFSVSAALTDDALSALRFAAAGFALSQLQNYLLVVPQALQRYDRSAGSEAVFGIIANLVSAAVALSGGGIAGVVLARVAVSFVNLLWLTHLLSRLDVPLAPALPGRATCVALASFSGHSWLSRLASVLHQHADKLLVGALAGPIALAFYTVPAQLAGRLLGLTYRLASVIYPRVSQLAASGGDAALRTLYLDASRIVGYLNFSALGLVALTGDVFLRRWVGAEFVADGYPVLLLITAALLADSLTTLPSLVNDGLGHPKVTGRFAIVRGLLGVVLVWLGIQWGGIVGAAAAHLLASVLMAALFIAYVHGRTVPVAARDALRACWWPGFATAAAALLLALPLKWLLPDTPGGLLVLAGSGSLLLLIGGLAFIVRVDERAALRAASRRLMPGVR